MAFEFAEDLLEETKSDLCDERCRTHLEKQEGERVAITHEASGLRDSISFSESASKKEIKIHLRVLIHNQHETIVNERKKEDLRNGGWSAVGVDSRGWAGFKDMSIFSGMQPGRTVSITRLNESEWFFKSE